MKTSKHIAAVFAVITICSILAWLTSPITGKEATYEVETQITTPEYRTDAGRAIDAYERLMERHMDLMEKNLLRFGTDCQAIGEKLDSLNSRLSEVLTRLERIEKALGIEPNITPPATAQPAGVKDTPRKK